MTKDFSRSGATAQRKTQIPVKRFVSSAAPLRRCVRNILLGVLLLIVSALFLTPVSSSSAPYDLVILNGRVVDPESRIDAIRNLGISNGTIKTISTSKLAGRTVIDAHGLVVSPGFIDLHQHGQDEENYRFKAMDGVTTALELEVGTGDVDAWYAQREQKSLINYGVSVGHLAARMAAMHEPVTFLPTGEAARRPATDAQINDMKQRLEKGLKRGAVAVGFGIRTPERAAAIARVADATVVGSALVDEVAKAVEMNEDVTERVLSKVKSLSKAVRSARAGQTTTV